MEYKRQHIVSQAYLKAWLDQSAPSGHEPYVWLISRDRKRIVKKSPRKILHEVDFYTVFGGSGFRDVRLEKRLSETESKFIQIRDSKIFNKAMLTQQEMDDIVLFVATSYARTKLNKETQSGIWKDYSQLMLQINPNLKETELYETVQNLKAQPMPFFFNHFLQIVLPYLNTMNVSIISVSDHQSFITSDNPVIWIDPSLFIPGAPISIFGIQSPLLNVMMPISPKMIVILSREYFRGYSSIEKDGYADEVNSMMVNFAEKWLVSNSNQTKDYWFRSVNDSAQGV